MRPRVDSNRIPPTIQVSVLLLDFDFDYNCRGHLRSFLQSWSKSTAISLQNLSITMNPHRAPSSICRRWKWFASCSSIWLKWFEPEDCGHLFNGQQTLSFAIYSPYRVHRTGRGLKRSLVLCGDYWLEFDLNERNKFSQLLQLEIDMKLSDEVNFRFLKL